MSGDEGFLRRWSRLKSVPAQTHAEPPAERVEPPPGREAGAIEPPAQTPPPPIESLTPESDFTPFMQEDVDPALRRGALKKLREAVGDEAYYSGHLPPHVPVWRFAQID